MNVGRAAGFTGMQPLTQFLAFLLSFTLLFATVPLNRTAAQDAQAPPPAQTPQGPPYNPQTPEQLQQLVAPIALYPDSLVAQILAASTFPEQVVEADRWVQAHPDLKGDALGQAVDQMQWDPSVKALTAFPSVLGNMDKNLSWTSTLGDAYYNQQQDVMDAVQVMRSKAEQAGNLKTTPQQTVTTQGSTIIIQPATSMRRRSSATQGSGTGCTGKREMASPRVRLDRWSRGRLHRRMRTAGEDPRCRIAATIFTS